MRNLKRALSLALASVMLVGMMVVGSSAASYPDVDDENNVEAIAVLEAVKVMIGNEKGDFEPEKNVTRNEMAVIMAKLILGTYEADSYVGSHPFTDVPDWASRYVAACYNAGIVAGRGEGIYDGNSTVTAVEAAAMMLRALGYEDLSKGYAQWDQPVAAKANEINLFADLGGSSNAAMNRDSVAQLALNTLQATMVTTVRDGQDITLPDGTVIAGNRRYTLRTERYGWVDAIDDEGVPGSNGDYGYLQLGEYLYKGDLKLKDYGKDSITDAFQRPSTEWTYKNDSVIKYADKAELTYTKDVKLSDIYKDLGKPSIENVYFIKNGDDTATDNSGAAVTLTSGNSNKVGNKGAVVEVYKDDEDVTIIVVDTYLAQVKGDYKEDDEKLELDLLSDGPAGAKDMTLEQGDFNNALDSFADEDYVLITMATEDEGANYSVQSITLAETLTGNVDRYTSGKNVVVDGETYEYNANCAYKDSTLVSSYGYTVDDEAVLILDGYGYVIGLGDAQSSSSYVFLKDFDNQGSFSDTVVADAFFSDGTRDEIVVNKIGSTKISDKSNALCVAGWYTYSRNDDGYNLTAVPSGRVVNNTTYTSGNAKIIENNKTAIYTGANGASSPIYGTNSTVFVVKDGRDVDVYTGIKNVPTITTDNTTPGSTLLYAVKRNNTSYATYVFVDVGDGDSEGGDSLSSDLLFVMRPNSDVVTTKDGTVYTYENVMKNGTKEKTTADSDMLNYPGLYWDVRYNDEDQVTGVKRVVWDSTGTLTSSGSTTAITGSAAGTRRDGITFSGSVTAENGVVTVGSYTLPAMAEDFNIRVIEMDGNDRNIKVSTSASVEPVDRHFKDMSTSGAAFWVLDSGEDFVTDLYIMYNKASNTSTVERTVTAPDAVAAAAPKGAYSATISGDTAGKATQGTTITVTVTCDTAAASGQDTVTVTVDGTPATLTSAAGSNVGMAQAATATFTFTMPDANVKPVINVTNASLPAAGAITIGTQPVANGSLAAASGGNVNSTAVAATAASPNDTLTYQWYKVDNATGANPVAVSTGYTGANTTTLSADAGTLTVGTAYYFVCKVTNAPAGYTATTLETSVITVTPS